MADQAADLRLGQRLGNYLLRSVIGRGGMGTVYRADHIYLKRPVAVKVLHRSYFDQRDARERFLREAQAAGRIDHPNIIGVTDFGEAPDGTVFLVMAHVNGNSLDRVLRHEERLPLFRTLVILSQVTRALGAAHEQGIIHHDLKPDNIMLQKRVGRREVVRLRGDGDSLIEPEGTFDFVTILDFGASKYLDQAMVGSGVVIGTPTYMAPETARDGVADAPLGHLRGRGGVLRDADRHRAVRGRRGDRGDAEAPARTGHPAPAALPAGGDHRRGGAHDHEGAWPSGRTSATRAWPSCTRRWRNVMAACASAGAWRCCPRAPPSRPCAGPSR